MGWIILIRGESCFLIGIYHSEDHHNTDGYITIPLNYHHYEPQNTEPFHSWFIMVMTERYVSSESIIKPGWENPERVDGPACHGEKTGV